MAASKDNAISAASGSRGISGTALRGCIEAIGVHDLLRIGVTKGSSGRLLVFNEQFDAELCYYQGRLTSATSDKHQGIECLNHVLEMTEGEFEFTTSDEPTAHASDDVLHEALTRAIKSHYQERIRARQDSAGDQAPLIRTSGVHRVPVDPKISVSPIVTIEKPKADAPSVPRPPPSASLASGEIGRAFCDSTGRPQKRVGSITAQEIALASLAAKHAQTLSTVLGVGELHRLEVVAANHHALLCRVGKDGFRMSTVNADPDVERIWADLEP